jgi:hypothetical protein
MKVYAEIGYGNPSFLSTEFEDGETEHRVSRFVKPEKVLGYYIRCWIGKTVFIISTNDGFETTKKDRNRFKLLLGVSGTHNHKTQ